MSTMQFDDSQFKLRSRRLLGEPEVPGMIKFLVTKGIVKEEKQAILTILTIIILMIAASVFIFKSNSVSPATLDYQFADINSL